MCIVHFTVMDKSLEIFLKGEKLDLESIYVDRHITFVSHCTHEILSKYE